MNVLGAKKKVRMMGFSIRKVDVKPNFFRFRQSSPGKFQKRSFRTILVGHKGTELILGRPKGHKHMRVQSVLIKRN